MIATSLIDGVFSRKEVQQAQEAAIKALTLDPALAEPHTVLARIKLFVDWDWSGAEAEFKQSLALNPNFVRAHEWYSVYLVIMERLDEAVNEGERARDLDPFDFLANEWLGQALYHARRYDDALRQIRRTLEMFPDFGGLYSELADVYEQEKMFAEAFAARQKAATLILTKPNLEALAEAYKHAGYRGYLLKQIQILEQAGSRQHVPMQWAYLAHLYAMLDDEAHAMSCLEREYENHSEGVLFAPTAPELDSIRSSRFRDLVRRIGLPLPSNDKN